MEPYVPLLQTMLWILTALGLAWVLRREVTALRRAFQERLLGGAAVKLGGFELGEVRSEVEQLRGKVDDLSTQVSELFLTSLSGDTFTNLSKLASGDYGAFTMHDGLARELRHLRDHGYVRIAAVRSIPASGPQLNDFVVVTDVGRDLVRLRGVVSANR